MKNTGLKEYKDFREGQVLTERIGSTSKTRLVLCKGIYIDDKGKYHAGFAYIDRKATRENKRTTVSSKSPMWFEGI